MRKYLMVIVALFATSCSDVDVEEIAFRKTLEYMLIDLCDEEDKACPVAVKAQIKPCMESSDWRKYLNSSEDEKEFERFINKFYACIVDAEGNPYFEVEQ